MKKISDYVLQAMENLSNDKLSEDELQKELKKAEAITKLAEASIKEKEADTRNAEVETRRTEMLIKVKMMQGQLEGKMPNLDSIPLLLATSKGENND